MRYESKNYGKVDWPLWHDVVIVGGCWVLLATLPFVAAVLTIAAVAITALVVTIRRIT